METPNNLSLIPDQIQLVIINCHRMLVGMIIRHRRQTQETITVQALFSSNQIHQI
jgi:hypothetical protein